MKKSDVVNALMEENEVDGCGFPFVIGEKVFIRTVTFHCTGKITGIKKAGDCYFLVLEDAAWVASSGRFSTAIEEGTLDEVEVVSTPIRVNVSSIVDVFHWNHPLPRTTK